MTMRSPPLTTHSQFGRAVGAHTGRFAAGGWLWYAGGLLLVAAVMNMGQGALVLFGGSPAEGWSKLGLAAVAFLSGASIVFVATMRWRQTVTVHERGLVHSKLIGKVEISFAEISDVKLVRTYSRIGTSEALHLVLRDGREVTIGSVTDLEQLAGMIRHAPAKTAIGSTQ